MGSAAAARPEPAAGPALALRRLTAVVDSAIRLPPETPPRLAERLRLALRFPNPEFEARRRFGRSLRGPQGGRVPEHVDCAEDDATTGALVLPRGAVDLLKKVAREERVEVGFLDRRVTLPRLDLEPPPALRPYQERALAAAMRGVQGTVVMPCGAGKTVVGAALVRAARQPALVLVHTLDLVAQWTTALEGAGVKVGVVADGRRDVQPLTVATVQSLAALPAPAFEGIAARFGLAILDESHHAPAEVFRGVLHRLPARRRIGLTATPERADGLTPLLGIYLGRPLFEVSHDELVAGGYLVRPEIRPVVTTFAPEPEPASWNGLMDLLVDDEGRNALITDLVAREAADGHVCLVLSGRVAHCKRLRDLLAARGLVAELLAGEVRQKERERILAAARAGRAQVLVATTVADEGLDVPRLSRVFLVYPTRAEGRLRQRLGRIMRIHPEKGRAVCFDLVDAAVPALRRQYAARRRIYADLAGEAPAARAPKAACARP